MLMLTYKAIVENVNYSITRSFMAQYTQLKEKSKRDKQFRNQLQMIDVIGVFIILFLG